MWMNKKESKGSWSQLIHVNVGNEILVQLNPIDWNSQGKQQFERAGVLSSNGYHFS